MSEEKDNGVLVDVMAMLPSVDDAGVIAANIASNARPKLTTQEEALFIAGFQECVKYLRGAGKRQLLDFIRWEKQVAVDDLTDKEIVEFYLARKAK